MSNVKRFSVRPDSGYFVIWDSLLRSFYRRGWSMKRYKTEAQAQAKADKLNK